MIESVSIKNVATYGVSGVQLNNLKKVNFIYGSNGSGKTTLSNYIKNQTDALFKDCSLIWKNNQPVASLVYNKEFKERNFGSAHIDGVFTLGQATKEQTEVIEQKKVQRDKLKEDGTAKRTSLDKQIAIKLNKEADFKEEVWLEVYKKYEIDFKDAFRGSLSKESFCNKFLTEFDNKKSETIPLELLRYKAKTIFGNAPVAIPFINNLEFSRTIEIESDKIWLKKIVGKADVEISKLIQKLNLNDWVNHGRDFLEGDNVCPFCQQKTITDNFKKQLDDYFDEAFLQDNAEIQMLSKEYSLATANILNILQQIEINEKANLGTKLDLDKFSAYLKTASSQISSNQQLLSNKFKEPSRSIVLISLKEQLTLIQDLINVANREVEKHNNIVANYSIERTKLVSNIWRFVVDENQVRIQNFNKTIGDLQKGIDGITLILSTLLENHKAIDKEIKLLSKNVTGIQPSIDEINKTLSSYGFHSFSIVPSKVEANKYQIQRENGILVGASLSEGEITFITFLYFLQLTKGSLLESSVSDERILIIDDPISSLDSNILFVVSSLVKEIIKSIKKGHGNIKQLIVLTHNVYFHKEVSFIDGRTKHCNDTFYYMLKKNNNVTSIQTFEMNNPIQNSYELLWMEIKNKHHSSSLTIQNTMRRIIENYFKILGKYGDDELLQRFENQQEQQICRSLICWINDGSHSIPDDLYIELQEDTIEKYCAVFKSIFDYTNHSEHYNMMMGEERIN